MSEDASLWALFLSAFISSTLFPGGSEAVLAALAMGERGDRWVLFGVATFGNTLGAMTSYGIGRLIARRYPAQQLTKPRQRDAVARVQRWGSPILLLSWLPVVGDPLCVAAGWLRINAWYALAFTAVGKAARYAAVLAAV